MASFAPREAHKDTIHPNPKGYCSTLDDTSDAAGAWVWSTSQAI